MKIELIKENEFEELHNMIAKTIKTSFKVYYPQKSIDYLIDKALTVEILKKRANYTNFYVGKLNDKIIACGAIGPYWGSETESSLFTIFVDSDYQKMGYGKQIIETLENDEYFLRAKRIEIPASIVGIPFYKKMGYEFKNGELIYEDGHFAMEKFNHYNKK